MNIDVDRPDKSPSSIPLTVDDNVIADSGDNAAAEADMASKSNDNIKYTIQVGVFSNIFNAQTMQKDLQQLDAYITEDFYNNNKVRYNVRLGYFMDKKSAIAALHDYRNNLQ